MDKDRVKDELTILNEHFTATWDSDLQAIRILDYPFPDRWLPQEAPVLIVLPESYPQHQPQVYIRAEMHYRGLVKHRMRSNFDGWHGWCTHQLPWNPQHHDIGNLLSMMQQSFRHPHLDDPFDPDKLEESAP